MLKLSGAFRAVVVGLLITFVLAGCGGGGESTSSESISIPTVDQKKADERAIQDVIDQFWKLEIRSQVKRDVKLEEYRPLLGPELFDKAAGIWIC